MEQEVDEVIRWLTGYSQPELEGMLERLVSYGDYKLVDELAFGAMNIFVL